MPSLIEIAAVAAGGAVGAASRYCLQAIIPLQGKITLIGINLAGCLLIGIAWGLFSRCDAPRWLTTLLIPGLLGGFTTFSSFAYDTLSLMRDGNIVNALLYVGITVIGGVALTWAGWTLTHSTQ